MKPLYLLGEQLLVCLALLVFISGFITIPPTQLEDRKLHDLQQSVTTPKVVLMVIDGLRSDHVLMLKTDLDTGGTSTLQYLPHMPYVAQLLTKTQQQRGTTATVNVNDGDGALAFDVITSTPTVTAPRLQSLVSGTIPGFFSVATNFGASRLMEDNLLARWKSAGRRIRMYGDETWLKMFPDVFEHADPVTSFFVSDHVEVDRNVSRHLNNLLTLDSVTSTYKGFSFHDSKAKEVKPGAPPAGIDNWDVAVLHYIGLDHIGHAHAAQQDLMEDKLKQMNDVVLKVHTALKLKGVPYVLLVCGDHGMLDGGGHGGGHYDELHTAAVVLTSASISRSPKESFVIRQADLASTLGVVSGVGVPRGSVGVPLMQVVRGSLDTVGLYELFRSEARRLLGMTRGAGLPHADASALMVEAEWIEAQNMDFLSKLRLDAAVQPHSNAGLGAVTGSPDAVPTDLEHKLQQLVSLYSSACHKASEVLVSKMQTYDLPVLVPSAAVIALVAVCRMLHTLVAATSRRPPVSSILRPSTVLSCTAVCVCLVLVSWAVACGAVASATTTQLCRPASAWSMWLLLLPAVYAVALAGLVLGKLGGAVRAVAASLVSCLRRGPSVSGCVAVMLVGGTLAHSLSLLGTSFVEEEHQAYYLLHTTAQAALGLLAVVMALAVGGDGGEEEAKWRGNPVWGSSDGRYRESLDSGLLKSHDTMRRNFKSAYDKFGLNQPLTGSMYTVLDAADSNLAVVLDQSQAKQEQTKRKKVRQQLLNVCLALLVSLILFRLTRTWNATGDKWRHLADLSVSVRMLSDELQHYLLLLGLTLVFFSVRVCQPLVLIGCTHIYGRFHPFTVHSDGYYETVAVYVTAVLVLLYGVLRNVTLRYVLRSSTNIISGRVSFFLLFVGLLTVNDFRQKHKSRQSPTLPTTTTAAKACEDVDPVKFRLMVGKHNANSHLLASLLEYVCAAVVLVWLVTQRQDNVLLCVLLLMQARLVCGALVRLTQCGVPGVSSCGSSDGSLQLSCVGALSVVWMAQAFFFAQGNSNALSRLNLAAGFLGVSTYRPAMHALLIAIHTLAAPLLTYLYALQQHLAAYRRNNGAENAREGSFMARLSGYGWLRPALPLLLSFWCARLGCCALYAVTLLLQRDHLFVWTVLAPKLLYEAAHLVVVIVVNALVLLLAAVFT